MSALLTDYIVRIATEDYQRRFTGYTVRIATKEYQRRRHHKKRINKKWRKKYGLIEVNLMPDGQVIKLNDELWMTKKTFQEVKKALDLQEEKECRGLSE